MCLIGSYLSKKREPIYYIRQKNKKNTLKIYIFFKENNKKELSV
jgi:hypothetical protein